MSRLFYSMVVGLVVSGMTSVASDSWQRLDGCRLVENPTNDGDSFEIEWGGRRHVIRLYFIDCLEKSLHSQRRRAAQAACFGMQGVPDADLVALAERATALTRSALSDPFVVHTRWQPLQGDPHIFRAFVETADGHDLARLLVSDGLAIVRETPLSISDHPDGRDADLIARNLRRDETKAHTLQAGAWAGTPALQLAPAQDTKIFLTAADRSALRARAGQRVRVCGRVGSVEPRANGRFTLITFSGNDSDDLRLLVRRKFLPSMQETFCGNFESWLCGKEIEVDGMVTIFRDTPQIEIESPEQILVRNAEKQEGGEAGRRKS